ncbi:MAG: hypothetical protein PHW76_03745 [Alphaproteobacteria bacterium]|nr:hypothetical protein [Alphaproteobacteria bacterium]
MQLSKGSYILGILADDPSVSAMRLSREFDAAAKEIGKGKDIFASSVYESGRNIGLQLQEDTPSETLESLLQTVSDKLNLPVAAFSEKTYQKLKSEMRFPSEPGSTVMKTYMGPDRYRKMVQEGLAVASCSPHP